MDFHPGTPTARAHALKRRGRGLRTFFAALAGVAAIGWGLNASRRPSQLRPEALATVRVDQGDVALVVTESGTLESADVAVIRCQVESFLALPSGSAAVIANPGQAARLAAPKSSAGGGTSVGQIQVFHAVGRAASEARAMIGVAIPTTGGTVAAKGVSASAAAVPTAVGNKGPEIQSFDYYINPHVPLRLTVPALTPRSGPAPQPPKIISILDEGTRVKAGDVVCELDSSAFKDELYTQQARCLQTKSWVEQAKSILSLNEISLREYREGIYPRDLELVRQRILTCKTEQERARRNLEWSRDLAAKEFRTQAQVKADELWVEEAEIKLRDAENMLWRLKKYTGRRIVKSRLAKIESIRADMYSLESTYQLEGERLKRIVAMIANCKMKAPRDGIVVHANRTNPWGTVEMQIREGLTVYPLQPIYRIFDPKHMQVKARINESLVSRVKTGQAAEIRLDAYPDRPLTGKVSEITPIPAPANGPISEVRAYYATVRIEAGSFDELRTGLSGEVKFLVGTHRKVPRIPLESVRWVEGQTFVALPGEAEGAPEFRWKPIALGMCDTEFAEVGSGLKPGDEIAADPELLPAPEISHAGPVTAYAPRAKR